MTAVQKDGFTLIELSIVLVIVGLLVGGVLVGRDLIKAAQIRATVSQIEKYKTAVATFKSKYNALPGDLRASDAAALGFIARHGGVGDGDGNGIIEGLGGGTVQVILGGETVFFWTDLSSANLIDGSFSDSSDNVIVIGSGLASAYAPFVPAAKTGQNAYIFAAQNLPIFGLPGYTGLVFSIAWPTFSAGTVVIQSSLTPIEAQSIDSKIDDGMPLTGLVVSAAPGQGAGAASSAGRFSAVAGTTSEFCVSNATASNIYNTSFPDNANCGLLIAAGF